MIPKVPWQYQGLGSCMFKSTPLFIVLFSGPDGTISHKTSGIEIGQKGFKDGIHEFAIDPRDIEVCIQFV
jgi:hypothetical protein